MAQAIVKKIDEDPSGLARATEVCARWRVQNPGPAVEEWWQLLQQPWAEIRGILLDPGEEGCRLRQSDPFVGILTREERWAMYRDSSSA
jgi:hypothetical protein